MASAANSAFAQPPAERAGVELKDANGISGKGFVYALAIAAMAGFAILISRPASP